MLFLTNAKLTLNGKTTNIRNFIVFKFCFDSEVGSEYISSIILIFVFTYSFILSSQCICIKTQRSLFICCVRLDFILSVNSNLSLFPWVPGYFVVLELHSIISEGIVTPSLTLFSVADSNSECNFFVSRTNSTNTPAEKTVEFVLLSGR